MHIPTEGSVGPDTRHRSTAAPRYGDPYVPLAGNDGDDVQHFDLAIASEPKRNLLTGTALVRLHATENLSSYTLDLYGVNVQCSHRRRWSRPGPPAKLQMPEGRTLPDPGRGRSTSVNTWTGRRHHAMFTFAVQPGPRLSEITGLRAPGL